MTLRDAILDGHGPLTNGAETFERLDLVVSLDEKALAVEVVTAGYGIYAADRNGDVLYRVAR